MSNPIRVVEAFAGLNQFTEDECWSCWELLAAAPPRIDPVGHLTLGYLWQKLSPTRPDLALPQSWRERMDPSFLNQLSQSSSDETSLMTRLERGDALNSNERMQLFSAMIQRDPKLAFQTWLQHSDPNQHADEATWFAHACTDAKLREDMVSSLLNHATLTAHPASTGQVLAWLLRSWLASNPTEALAWAEHPRFAAYRATLEPAIAGVLQQLDPALAWKWADRLPAAERHTQRQHAIMTMAMTQPELGIQTLQDLPPGPELQQLQTQFSRDAASQHFQTWQRWVDSLAPSDAQAARAAAFPSWFTHEPESAAKWLSAEYQGPDRADLVASLITRSGATDPTQTTAWIRILATKEERYRAAMAALRALPPEDYQSAKQLIDAVEQPSTASTNQN